MSGKTGKRPTGRKPLIATREGHKVEGAFGKEKPDQVRPGLDNMDKAARKIFLGAKPPTE